MGRMKDLFGDTPFPVKEPHQLARRDDPATSYQAAASLADLSDIQMLVYTIHTENSRGLTDAELHGRCCELAGPRPESSYRKRRSDLAGMGLIVDSGYRRHVNGSNRVVWCIPGKEGLVSEAARKAWSAE